jgi:DNA-binding response OmpR family regulator
MLTFTFMEGKFYEITSLDAGAYDFLLKTASIPSLVCRLRAHLRRKNRNSGERTEPVTISIWPSMGSVSD